MDLVADFVAGYHNLLDNYSDKRVANWPMMNSPFPTLALCISYAYFSKIIGPKVMENRKPFQLKNILIVYNLVQVLISCWLFYECCMSGWFTHYSFRCQPVDYSESPMAMRMARGCWWYYMSKFSEFFDTIFFILRKKNDQVTTLHVIHHGVMPISVWFGVKFTPGGHSTFFGLLNTFVHIVMYSYYLFSALGPQFQKYLWWKKYLTAMQMLQFVLVMIHAFQLLFIDCNYPRAFVWVIGLHAIMFYFLFQDFYKQTYLKRKAAQEKKDKEANDRKIMDNQTNGFPKMSPIYNSKMNKLVDSFSTQRQRVIIDHSASGQ